MVAAVFLDRDGVINRSNVVKGKPYAPRKLEEFELLPQVTEAIKALSEAGFLIFVVTNQPDIGNGFVDAAIVEQMHAQLQAAHPITKIYVCPHKQTEGCDCRKPNPGLLFQAKQAFNINLTSSYMVGDRYSDIVAGQEAGCKTVFIDHKYVETPDFCANFRCQSLWEASQYIVSHVSR